jgi:hypothetical protein
MRTTTLRLFVSFSIAVCVATSAAGLAAQTPAAIAHAEFDTSNYLAGTTMGGPNLLLGIRATAPSSYAATRVEVFTGGGQGINTVSLWTHDASGNQPGQQLAIGSFGMSTILGWQGANLGAPVPIASGQTFWIVWGCINGSQISAETSGGPGAQPYRGSFNGGQTWNGPFQSYQWKLRIWSGSAGEYDAFGDGCNGASRNLPQLGWAGIPTLGAGMDLLLRGAPAGTLALLTVGDSDVVYNGTPLPFDLAPLGAPGCFVRASPISTVATLTGPAGEAAITLAVPPAAWLFGYEFFDQWIVADPAANALGFTVSNGGAGRIGM